MAHSLKSSAWQAGLVSATDFLRRGLNSAGAALLSLALLAGTARGQPVIVQQVEAFENPPTNTHYAPVNFNGFTTATSASYPGITFTAQGNTTDTVSSHAVFVANFSFGPGTVAQPFVTNVFSQTANNFLNGLNIQPALGPAQPLPIAIGNGIRVTNHSYAGTTGVAMTDENALRRIDYVVNNEDLVFAAGAVSGGAFINQSLVWAARNSLAVRGGETPFDPSAAANPITAGKRRTDVWFDSVPSFATGAVSGYSTALIGQATVLGTPNAARNQTVRSLIMTGADKTAVGTTTGPWTRDTANNLSIGLGAGKANYAQSLSILQAGERPLQAVTALTTPNVVSNSLQGFAFGTSTIGDQAIVINAPNGISQLTATLNWNVTQQTTGGTIDTSDAGRIFPDLALELRTATLVGGQFVLGPTALPQTGLSSNATLDNLEHLFFSSSFGGSLAAGTYAFFIRGDPTRTAVIGFSYDIVPVPEPIGCLVLLPVAVFVLRRRRESALAKRA